MKRMTVWLCVMLMWTLSGCGSGYEWEYETEEGLEAVDLDSVEERYPIRITVGDTVLSGVLYDTPTAADFAKMLPLTAELWHPAPGFARAFYLPEHIPRYAKAGYEYEPGSLAYWYEGPAIALVYHAGRDQTVVPVVPIGKITSDVSVFAKYGETITIELEELSDTKPDKESNRTACLDCNEREENRT